MTDILNGKSGQPLGEKKGWSEDWLKVKEANLLQMGGNKIMSPYEQSYVVYAAVRAIAENIPQAVFKVYDGDKEVSKDNPVQKLFDRPNSYTSRFELWENIATYLNLKGEAFIYMNKSVGQSIGTSTIPAELYSLDPSLMKHVVEDGQLISWVFNNKMPIGKDEVIHVKFFNPNNSLRGLSPIFSISNEMNADYMASKYNKTFFDNNATPDGVVEVDKDKEITIDELRKLKQMWNQTHSGVDNAHKIAFLLGGMQYKNMGMSQKEMEFILGREFTRKAILAAFRVNPFMAGFSDKGEVNRSTANVLKQTFWTNTLIPQMLRIQEKLNNQFFEVFTNGLSGKFDYSNIPELKGDLDASLETGQKMFALGYTRNEINERLNLEMPEDNDGDVRYLPMNLVEVGEEAEEVITPEKTKPNAEVVEEPEKFAVSPMIKTVNKSYQRNFLKIQKQMEKVLQKKFKRFLYEQRKKVLGLFNVKKDITPEQLQLLGNLGGFFEDQKTNLVKLLKPIYSEIMSIAGKMALTNIGVQKHIISKATGDIDEVEFIIDNILLESRLNKVSGVNQTLYDQIKSELFEGIKSGESVLQLKDRIKAVYNTSTSKALVIARTETSSLMNGTTQIVYADSGVEQKEWLSHLDGETRESHASVDGEIVPIGSTFSNGLMYPGDINAPGSETINCRCTLAPVIT